MLTPPKILFAAGGLVLLAACGAKAEGGAGDGAAQAASLSANGEPLRAGLYKVVQTGDVAIKEERCFTADAVGAGRFIVPGVAEDGWTIDANRMSGGTIEVAAHHGSGSRLAIDGTFERESFVVVGALEMKMNGETHVVRTQQRGTFAAPTCPEGMD